MTDDTYADDLDEAEEHAPERMPYPVKVAASLFGVLAVVTGFAGVVNITARDRVGPGVLLAAVAAAAVVTVWAMLRRLRFGSYVGFGLALILALASLQQPGVVLVGLGFLATVMGTLMTRSAKDWFGFA